LKALIEQRGVHAVFGDSGEGFGIEQNPSELAEFLVEMQALGVESVLEIGTGYKAGLARFLHNDMGWAVTSVDIQDYGHSFEGITFITNPDQWFADRTYDLVIIDGDHRYEAVRADHKRWGLHAEKVIAFHDIAGLRGCEGVLEYWAEISLRKVPDSEAPRGYVLKFTPGFHRIIVSTPQRGGIGWIDLMATGERIESEWASNESYSVDPDSASTVTHQWSPPEGVEFVVGGDLAETVTMPAPKKTRVPRKSKPRKKAADKQ